MLKATRQVWRRPHFSHTHCTQSKPTHPVNIVSLCRTYSTIPNEKVAQIQTLETNPEKGAIEVVTFEPTSEVATEKKSGPKIDPKKVDIDVVVTVQPNENQDQNQSPSQNIERAEPELDIDVLVKVQPRAENKEKDTDVETTDSESDYDDPDIDESPSAWLMNRTADTLDVASQMTVGTLRTGSQFAQAGIESVSEATTSVLPGGHVPVPGLVKDTVHGVSNIAAVGIGTLLGGVKDVGNFAGQVVGVTVGQFLTGNEKESEYSTWKAASRLARVSVRSYSRVADSLAQTTQDLHNSVTKEAVVVATHVAGKDVGELVETGSKVSEEVLKLGITLNTLGHQTALNEVASEATKKMMKHVVIAAKSSTLAEIKKAKEKKASEQTEKE